MCNHSAAPNDEYADYFRAHQAILNEYREKVYQLDRSWQKLHGRVPKDPKVALNAVIRATRHIAGVFSPSDVMVWIERNDSELARSLNYNSVRGAIRRLCEREVLIVVEAGKGRRAGRYRQAPQEDRPGDPFSPH